MRYNSKNKHLSTREIEKFAWLPVRVKRWDITEVAWMERVKIRQTWRAWDSDTSYLPHLIKMSLFGGYWDNDWFL